jgi:hypothetical protein
MVPKTVEYDLSNFFPLIDYFHNFADAANELMINSKSNLYEIKIYHLNFINDSFLKNINTPVWFLNYPVQEFNYKPYCSLLLTKQAINFLNKNEFSIYLVEPLNFYGDCFKKNELLFYLNTFAKNNNLKTIKIYTCEKNVKALNNYYENITIVCKNIFLRIVSKNIKKFINLEFDFNKKQEKIEKKFWCGNIEYSQHRHFMICFLLSKSGNYSWYHGKNLLENERYCPRFLKDINSEKSFIDTIKNYNEKYIGEIYQNNTKLMKKFPVIMDNKRSSKAKSIVKYYDECFVSVITETIFNSPYSDISEKALYAIAYGKPFIVVGTPRCLEYLKSLGFKTFDEFWDESYDNEKDAQKRLLMLFDLIEKIDNYTIEELKQIYTKMIPILKHNLNTLKNLRYNNKEFK